MTGCFHASVNRPNLAHCGHIFIRRITGPKNGTSVNIIEKARVFQSCDTRYLAVFQILKELHSTIILRRPPTELFLDPIQINLSRTVVQFHEFTSYFHPDIAGRLHNFVTKSNCI